MELEGVPRDTSERAERRQLEGLRAMTPEQRLEQTVALCAMTTELALAGIALREGALPENELRRRLGILRYGPEIVARVEAHRALLHERTP